MRAELKIGIVLFGTNSLLKHLISLPEFVSGLLIGVSIFFFIVGMIPVSAYLKFKTFQAEKFSRIKRLVNPN